MVLHPDHIPRSCRTCWAVFVAALVLPGTGCNRPAPTVSDETVAPAAAATPGTAAPPDSCRLVVLLVFDQMRGDYLERWQELWGKGGFRRLQSDGASFTRCYYPFACTETGPGHATLATGRSPSSHGIVGNYWYDRQKAETVYCVAGVRSYEPVPSGAAGDGPSTPEYLLGPALADAFRDVRGDLGRVFSLSLKDRAAVLLAGRRPNACYWFDLWTGGFMTSSYYRDRPHPWLTDFNRGRPADHWFARDWVPLRPDLDYSRHSGPPDAPGRGNGWLQRRAFPHPTNGGLDHLESKPYANRDYYGALLTSPQGDDLLLELAEKAIEAENLGSGPAQDLLCLSFSSLDAIGHSWGPDSPEVLDTMLRADRLVAKLLAHLDARVGRDRYLLVLTSDHGICPLPELTRRRHDAGRVSLKGLCKQANAILDKTYGEGHARWIEETAGTWLYFNHNLLAQRGLKAADVERALTRELEKYPGVLAAFGRSRLASLPEEDRIGQAVRRSFHPDRCGDLMVVLKPYYVPGEDLVGTSHGSPHLYDTHVPLLVYGRHVRAGRQTQAITPHAVAGILATGLGIPPPDGIEASVPDIFVSKP